jgi:lipid II:glycine glycyltransferase (peptidoglycan interpeptide bridge formation enzyme)
MNLSSVKLQEVKNRQPQYTWILDINKTTEQLLQEMHSKTRYNIRVAEKKEVYIDHVKNLDVFLKLNETTTERNKFISHPRQYIEKLLSLSDVFQFNAYIDKTPVASAIILRHQKSFIYLLGASSNEYRNAMSPYLLHWDIINTGKKEGIDTYDFWGIAPPAKKENVGTVCFHTYCFEDIHPLSGVSRFKAGWGGAVKSYPQAYEIIINPLTYIIVKFIYALRGRNRIVGHPDN